MQKERKKERAGAMVNPNKNKNKNKNQREIATKKQRECMMRIAAFLS